MKTLDLQDGHTAKVASFVALLRACSRNKDLPTGIKVHDDILRYNLLEKCSDALVTMYAKCGAVTKAEDLFGTHKSRDVLTWTALISGCAQNGRAKDSLNHFEQMQRDGIFPDAVTFTCILKVCGSLGAIGKGEMIHDQIAKQGLLKSDSVLGTALVDMYAKCGALSKAEQVLDGLPMRYVTACNALLGGYAKYSKGAQALKLFEQMLDEGPSPDTVTFICVLQVCGSSGAVDEGEKIHDQIVKQGLLRNDVVLGTALVDMYAKCGALIRAQQVLEELPVRSETSWNALIAGYSQRSEGAKALKCFELMLCEGHSPDATTFVCVLKACGSIRAVEKGEEIHDEIVEKGLLTGHIVLGTALVDMYARCGALVKARRVLDELPAKDVVCWNALIAGYAELCEGAQAMSCYEQMQREGLRPNATTFTCILKACANVGAADKGEKIHDDIAKQGLLKDNIILGNALVDMYSKCGAVEKARQVLQELPSRNAISWTSLIAGYAQQCESVQALIHLEHMEQEGLSPDSATFLCVLSACSRLGLVEDAQTYFRVMSKKFGVKPSLEHCSCMVDLFGRLGHLDKAVGVIEEMSFSDFGVCSVLLGACQKWGDVKVGRWAFERAIQISKKDASVYVLMADIYATAGMQEDAENIEVMRIRNEAWKKPAQSGINNPSSFVRYTKCSQP